MTDARGKGIVYLIGAGPGDPGLITVRGLECLRDAEVVVYDYLVNPKLLSELPDDCERIHVGKKAGEHPLKQEEINALLVEKCRAGRRVVRLKGGDPFVFGRGGEEALALRDAGCDFEVVPGVTAAIAAAAYAGIPVTHRGLASAVTLVTGHEDPTKESPDVDWAALGGGGGTLVFYMGVRNLGAIAERLIAHGRKAETPAAVITWGTYPCQRTIAGTLRDIAAKAEAERFEPPALIVVGDVVSLRDELAWFERRPLFGRRIVLTRSREQAGELSRRLAGLGADVIECPVIRVEPPLDAAPLAQAAARAGEYDWIVFTSVNGVDAFFEALRSARKDTRALHGAKVCAIGPATCARAESHGIIVDLMPTEYVAESVAEAFARRDNLKGKRVLLPRGDLARPFLAEALRGLGAIVDEVVAYRTVPEAPAEIDLIRRNLADGALDAVTFASPSAVRNFVSLVGEDFFRETAAGVCLASIGPETSKTLSSFTDTPVLEAKEFTIDGLVEAVVGKFTSAPDTAGKRPVEENQKS